MVRGLVLGKFYPLHAGHTGLIQFAVQHCDELIVWICASDKEIISGENRLNWIISAFKDDSKIRPVLFNYNEDELPNTSVSSTTVSKIWAQRITAGLPPIDIIFSSEPYGDYVAQILSCRHISYNPSRDLFPVSASAIRHNPLQHWEMIAPAARPHFVKKIVLAGTESTGKSTLTELLATHYQTAYVPEMAREIVAETDTCTPAHLVQIAMLQAKTIEEKKETASRLLFIDTDVNITRSYSRFLFDQELEVPDWTEEANQAHLYLYLANDAPYIQDGTRLDKERRDGLDSYHRQELEKRSITFKEITGSTWEDRFRQAVSIVDKTFFMSDVGCDDV